MFKVTYKYTFIKLETSSQSFKFFCLNINNKGFLCYGGRNKVRFNEVNALTNGELKKVLKA